MVVNFILMFVFCIEFCIMKLFDFLLELILNLLNLKYCLYYFIIVWEVFNEYVNVMWLKCVKIWLLIIVFLFDEIDGVI